MEFQFLIIQVSVGVKKKDNKEKPKETGSILEKIEKYIETFMYKIDKPSPNSVVTYKPQDFITMVHINK